jgi:Fe-Mn family superoxide dismutase
MNTIDRRTAVKSLVVGGVGTLLAADSAADALAQTTAGNHPTYKSYEPRNFSFSGIKAIDPEMLEQHINLYKGYVTNVNKAQTAMSEMLALGKADTTELSETRRRLGFEYAGVRLHEFYFEMIKPGGSAVDGKLKAEISKVWGTWENWIADITRTAMMRGIGWAILYRDNFNGGLQNFWITDHENGHPPGFTPIFVLDIWEHAYIKQFGAAGRKGYVDALLKNVDWSVVSKRLP